MTLKAKIYRFIVLFTLAICTIAYGRTPVEFAQGEWANSNLITELDAACQGAKNYNHCFGIGLSISKAESQMGNDWINHWYFGRKASKDKSAFGFVKVYNRYYYIVEKYNEGWLFYGYWSDSPAPTSYCMSEDSSGSKWHCPNGRNNFNSVYEKYSREFGLSSTKMDEPMVLKKAPKPTGHRCKVIHTIEKWETLKVTNKRWVITRRLKDLWIGDVVAVCS